VYETRMELHTIHYPQFAEPGYIYKRADATVYHHAAPRAHDDIIVIAAEEEERVTSKNSNQAEFPACTKNRTRAFYTFRWLHRAAVNSRST